MVGRIPWVPIFENARPGIFPGERAITKDGRAVEVLFQRNDWQVCVRFPETNEKGMLEYTALCPYVDPPNIGDPKAPEIVPAEVNHPDDEIRDMEDLPPIPEETQDVNKRTSVPEELNTRITELIQELVMNQPGRWQNPPDKTHENSTYRVQLGMNPKTGKSFSHMQDKSMKKLWNHLKTIFGQVKGCPNITTIEVKHNAVTSIGIPTGRSSAHKSVIVAGGQFNGGELVCENWNGQAVKINIAQQPYICAPEMRRGTAEFSGDRWEAEGFVPDSLEHANHSWCKYAICQPPVSTASNTPERVGELAGINLVLPVSESSKDPRKPWEGQPIGKDEMPLPRQPADLGPDNKWRVEPPTGAELDDALRAAGVTDNLNLTSKDQLEYRKLFAYCWGFFDDKLRFVDSDPVGIQFTDPAQQPIKIAPYRLSPKKLEFVQEMIDEWLKEEVIIPGNSPWAFPVVCVPKPNSTDMRLCVDLRRLNQS